MIKQNQASRGTIYELLEQTSVADIMRTDSQYLYGYQSLSEALKAIIDANQQSAVVIDPDDQTLLGYIELQDLLRGLWSEDFQQKNTKTVANLMQTEIKTIKPNLTLSALMNILVVDKEKLFNVSDSGKLIDFDAISYSERLRCAKSVLPSVLTVVDDQRVVGVISIKIISKYLSSRYQA